MRRRSGTGGEPVKMRRRKTVTPKRGNLLNALRSSSDTTHETEVARLTRERDEALEQQTATSEVLRVISSSPGELQPVFERMLENAARVCDANSGVIYRWDGDALHLVAVHNIAPAYAEALGRSPLRPTPGGFVIRIVTTKSVIQIADLAAEPAYANRNPMTVAAVEIAAFERCYLSPS